MVFRMLLLVWTCWAARAADLAIGREVECCRQIPEPAVGLPADEAVLVRGIAGQDIAQHAIGELLVFEPVGLENVGHEPLVAQEIIKRPHAADGVVIVGVLHDGRVLFRGRCADAGIVELDRCDLFGFRLGLARLQHRAVGREIEGGGQLAVARHPTGDWQSSPGRRDRSPAPAGSWPWTRSSDRSHRLRARSYRACCCRAEHRPMSSG